MGSTFVLPPKNSAKIHSPPANRAQRQSPPDILIRMTMLHKESAREPSTISQEQTALLVLDKVTKDYVADGEPTRALNSISLAVAPGQFVALVGRSGCGKSTLLNLAGAMDLPTSGNVLVDGISTSSLDDAGLTQLRRKKVGFIFQSFQLLSTLTALENVELPLLLVGDRNARASARRVLDWVELGELGERFPHQL